MLLRSTNGRLHCPVLAVARLPLAVGAAAAEQETPLLSSRTLEPVRIKAQMAVQAGLGRLGVGLHRVVPAERSDAYAVQRSLTPNPRPVIFDVGAYIGDTAQSYLALFPEAEIHGFEPAPDGFGQLAAWAERHPQVRAHNLAIDDTEGRTELTIASGVQTNSLLAPATSGAASLDRNLRPVGKVTVESRRLDKVAAELGVAVIDILKIDVQGTEDRVLRGAGSLLNPATIKVIYLEANFVPMYEGQALLCDVWALLREAGYKLLSLYDVRTDELGRTHTADAIFI